MKRQGYLQPWGMRGLGNGQKGSAKPSESPVCLTRHTCCTFSHPQDGAGTGLTPRATSTDNLTRRLQAQARLLRGGEAAGPAWGVSFPSLPGAMEPGLLTRCLGRCPKSSQLTGEKSDGFLIFILLVSYQLDGKRHE